MLPVYWVRRTSQRAAPSLRLASTTYPSASYKAAYWVSPRLTTGWQKMVALIEFRACPGAIGASRTAAAAQQASNRVPGSFTNKSSCKNAILPKPR